MAAGGFLTVQTKANAALAKVKLMGADGLYSPDFLKAAGDAATNMYESSPDFSAFGPAYQTFLDKHQKKYGEKPASVFHAHAYDATNLLFAAVAQVVVQDPDGTLHIGRQALRDAVLATKAYQGLTGSLTRHEEAWLGRGVVVDVRRQIIDCLERALALNPQNATAREWLEQARRPTHQSQELRSALAGNMLDDDVSLAEPGDDERPVPRLGQ